jgi:hypothetical protein
MNKEQFLKEICSIAVQLEEKEVHQFFTIPILTYSKHTNPCKYTHSKYMNNTSSRYSNSKENVSNRMNRNRIRRPEDLRLSTEGNRLNRVSRH